MPVEKEDPRSVLAATSLPIFGSCPAQDNASREEIRGLFQRQLLIPTSEVPQDRPVEVDPSNFSFPSEVPQDMPVERDPRSVLAVTSLPTFQVPTQDMPVEKEIRGLFQRQLLIPHLRGAPGIDQQKDPRCVSTATSHSI
ncbi:hypothetical protein AVEN_133171-1 [Araneus ventricosus]|uniref:Uncharacterized protein n=1 Tax=Araneus ventricosus TaxID=182803 RepID=A0A4Y2UEE6_ARAVE|nr:hypothetical protein AVEN_133171-1 [Araneus ventricosus]